MQVPNLVYTVKFEFTVPADYADEAVRILEEIKGLGDIQELNVRVEGGDDDATA